MIANVLGLPFLGFALTIAIGSPLLDYIGMGLLLPMAGVCFTAGALIMMFAGSLAGGSGVYNVIWVGALVTGIGWGLVETVVNPLIASLYPEEKTGKLNTLHAWWPGGLVVGGLLGVAMSSVGFGWQLKLAMVIVPAVVVIALCIGVRFPPTERAAAGVSMGEMFRQLLNPLFGVLFGSMFLTAASELAPGQWVDFALSRTVHMPGILLLVYVSALMFVMRHFAGPLVHKLSPIGLLWMSCLMASLGLVALSVANSPLMGVLAATIWGTGVCYMWPTMLATASERFPRGGALLMGLMGTAGTLSIRFVLPIMGAIYDNKKIEIAGGDAAFSALPQGPELERVLGIAAQTSFRAVAILPAILLIVFGAIWIVDRSKTKSKSAAHVSST
jgi:fucose permease